MKSEIKPKIVSQEFIEKLKLKNFSSNPISNFTFYRTYSRFDENLNRRETWLEACIRASEYSVELAIYELKSNGVWIEELHCPIMIKEAEDLIQNMYELKVFVSGRTLYTGGSLASKLYPLSNFNCSSAVIDDFSKIGEMFYLLMVGTGFGFRVLKEDVEKLPKIRQDISINHKEYNFIPKGKRKETTSLYIEKDEVIMTIGDSKEGWKQSIDFYFDIISQSKYKFINKLTIIYDNVRPKGERLKIFGGTSSGHNSIKNMFITIDKVIKNELDDRIEKINNGKLRPIHVMDICNAVAYNVVSGGVRRSAQICLFSPSDMEITFAKYGLNGLYGKDALDNFNYIKERGFNLSGIQFSYSDDVIDFSTGEKIPYSPPRMNLSHRRMSNNSAMHFSKPTKEELSLIVKLLESEGEPGFINGSEALRRFPWFNGMNPCAEILLDDRGLCNLSTIPVINHVFNGVLNKESLFEAARLSARIGVRMTTIDLELKEWDAKQKKHRLTGTSLTGWQDAKDACNLTDEEEKELLRELRAITKKEAQEYSHMLRVPSPYNVTTVKPEGTQSLLAGGVSSGIHASHSPYYLRRIRISASDPLCLAMEEMGFKTENEVGQGVTYVDSKTGNQVTTEVSTKVITFPIKSYSKRTKEDLTVQEQFETYFNFQKNYTDQNTSNTITVRKEEWKNVEEILWERWDDILAVSFLSLDGGTYQLAPYEKISEEEYNKLIQEIPQFNPEILEKFETSIDFDIGSDSCETGACPIR